MKVDEGLSSRKLTHWLLHRFWREPLVEPHEQHRIRHWYRRVAARAKSDARRRVERASAFLAQGTAADGGVAEAPAAAAPPRPARFKLARAPEEADAPPAPDAAAAATDDDVDDEEWAKVEDFIPTRWAWLRCEAQARADELEDYITEELLSADLLDVLRQVQELNPEKSDPQPQQRLIWRGGGGTLTEAVLKAVKASARHAFNDSTLFFSKATGSFAHTDEGLRLGGDAQGRLRDPRQGQARPRPDRAAPSAPYLRCYLPTCTDNGALRRRQAGRGRCGRRE